MKAKQVKATLLTLLLGLSTSMTAQTTLPYIPMADDFGGQAVATPETFLPTTADFTLEVGAQGGTPVGIGFADVSYTPTADGRVRFVQKSGKIYVFENNAYAATLLPRYAYTEAGDNLVRNGSFETTDELFTAGRWKAVEWDTWDGGTPTWGGDVGYVNVRENASYRSDGMKSIILHSRSRYLCQRLTKEGLKAGAAYLLSCDHWTSEGSGNGGAAYRLLLGTALAGGDLLTLEGYTTSTSDQAAHSFQTVFRMPALPSGDIYLSFFRSEAKVDWLDNVRLVAIAPAATGLTGCHAATYATGAFAPVSMTLPDGVSIDLTDRLANPGFSNATLINGAPAGWTLDARVTQSKTSTVGKGNGLVAANQGHWQLWHAGGALNGRAYQLATGLPNGKYRVEADVVASGFGGSVALYANYGKSAVAANSAQRYGATGMVVDGTLELGLQLATTGGFTIDFDSFTLHYLGMDAEGYREVMALKVAETKQLLADLHEGYDGASMQAAVDHAESLADNAAADDIVAAIARLEQANADYQAFVAARREEQKKVQRFADLIAAAKAERAEAAYPAAKAFDAAIARAEAFLADLQARPDIAVTSQREALNVARETYYNSQYTVAPIQQDVSHVDLTLDGSEKFVLRVDGKPFYPTEIQVRPDKLRGYEGWSEAEIEAAFKRAADDGFSTLSIPLFWSEVEPEKNHFDWRILDRYLGWCKKYGMRAELLWFSWSSGGRVQYLWNYGGRQQLRTPDYVCSMEGTSEFNMLRTQWEYSLDWRDTELRDRETLVLGRVMEHVALWDANNGRPHTVIGVQLGNEARSHGNNTATDDEIIDYYHHVGAAVKQSKYVTWTRLNCVSWETPNRTRANERKRSGGGTNIDFVGIDIYGTNALKVLGNMDGFLGETGKNYRMIMEIDAKDSNSPLYQMAALAGDKAFDYYNLGHVDGNGLYANNGHVLTERSHIALVRQRNKILNLANQDIALKKHGKSLYVYNYSGGSTYMESGLKGIAFTPKAGTTQAVAVLHSANEIALLATAAGTFTLPASIGVQTAEVGHFDSDNNWVKESDAAISNNSITMTESACVRIVTKKASEKTKVFTIGDSTMADKAAGSTERGWGTLFPLFVDGIQVEVKNNGLDGRSTRSFINEGKWAGVCDQLSEGDYVLIQFGHNDEKTDVALHTDAQTTYKENLTKFVSDTRAKGARPVLLTPIVRRVFGSDGNIEDGHSEYADAMRELAKALYVPLIDMNRLSAQYENVAGIEGSRQLHEYFPGKEIDNTHLCQLGAYITARCVAEQIGEQGIGIALNGNPQKLDGACTSTLTFAQHAFSSAFPQETAASTLALLDEQIRRLRREQRRALLTGAKPASATFAVVNADFAEGNCWYNDVQTTLPMGWKLDKDVSGQQEVAVKTADGMTYFIVWAPTIRHIDMYQTITELPQGTYEVSAMVKASKGASDGHSYLYISSGDEKGTSSAKTPEQWEELKAQCDVQDGTLRIGLRSESGWYARLAQVRLSVTDGTTTGTHRPGTSASTKSLGYYTLDGRAAAAPQRGLYIIRSTDGSHRKVFIQ